MEAQDHVILKQFRKSALRDILYLQAQLVHLETEYERVAEEDRSSEDPIKRFHDIDWFTLSCPENGLHCEQWTLALQIRSMLKQYCE